MFYEIFENTILPILLAIGTVSFAVLFVYLKKYIEKRKVLEQLDLTPEDVKNAISASEIVLKIIQRELIRNKADKNKVQDYVSLIINGIEYAKSLDSDIPKEEKIIDARNFIKALAVANDITLNPEQLLLINDVLIYGLDITKDVEKIF